MGMIETIRKIYSQSGPTGFYKGLGVSLVLVSNPVINFTINEFLKKISRK